MAKLLNCSVHWPYSDIVSYSFASNEEFIRTISTVVSIEDTLQLEDYFMWKNDTKQKVRIYVYPYHHDFTEFNSLIDLDKKYESTEKQLCMQQQNTEPIENTDYHY